MKLYGQLLLLTLAAAGCVIDGNQHCNRTKRYIFIPLNIPFPNRPATATTATQTQTTPAPGGQQLSIADNVALSLINSFRASHRARPVTWNAQLRTQALQCANARAAATSLNNPTCAQAGQSVSSGFSAGNTPSQRVRFAITDLTIGWLAGYPGRPPLGSDSYWTNPTAIPGTESYTQMIWAGHREVGCASSTSRAPSIPVFIFVCIWTPPGNIPTGYATNVLSDSPSP